MRTNAICKIVDYAIIYKYGSELHTSSLQFAYKQYHSTIMCTSIFQEVVNYYNHNGSNVYACLVDASKAFDRINISKLFQTVLKRKLPGTIIRLLFDSYTRQQSFVKWGQEFSDVIYIYAKWRETRRCFICHALLHLHGRAYFETWTLRHWLLHWQWILR